MQKILRIGKWISASLAVFTVVFFAVPLLPIRGNYELKAVMSGSMEPAIPTGSIVVILPETKYSPGDVITFYGAQKSNIPTTHRITEVRVQTGEYVFRTKGDANGAADPGETPQSNVIGKVLFSIPWLGYVLAFFKTPAGFVLFILLPAAALIVSELVDIVKAIQKRT